MSKIQVKIPGKLYLAGEYAVVDGGLAIIAAVNQYLQVTVEATQTGQLHSDQQADLNLSWYRKDHNIVFDQEHPYSLVQVAMQVTEEYLRDLGEFPSTYYRLAITSELDDSGSGQKYGLGSSGAVTVAVIKAISLFYGQSLSPLVLYKLSVLAQTKLGLSGSFGDLAASSFGGLIAYQRPLPAWLLPKIAEQTVADLVALDWPNLVIERLLFPENLQFLVGWTRSVASTEGLLDEVARNTFHKKQIRQDFVTASQACLERMVQAFQEQNSSAICQEIRHNRFLLRSYAEQVGLHLETPALKTLIDLAEEHGAAAKTSGAGGGDCGIALLKEPFKAAQIQDSWVAAGILPLDLLFAPPFA
ncbi:phosphomevalonate kinase [Streptococcus ovuberis]|uniref:Phosphomevalonate kinase n=1 Tax=Streptococcus ovuberis TaxID=1936207 RepID=A0A7X6N048_9STRE|nr:phosphomevalonate kinase [Streptococcus ovuberis]NKZ20561.1 phosphomevalonate kinase [Streptococcus ovuberis]